MKVSKDDYVVYSDIPTEALIRKLKSDKDAVVLLSSEDDFCAMFSMDMMHEEDMIRIVICLDINAKRFISDFTLQSYQYKYRVSLYECIDCLSFLEEAFPNSEIYHADKEKSKGRIRRSK